MPKIEIDLTDAQLDKVEILKSKDIDVGQAIDLLFEVQNEALAQLEEQKQANNLIEKIKDNTLDSEIKKELLKENYGENETYDKTVQTAKHGIKWSKYFKI